MKGNFLLAISLFVFSQLYSQITKGNWLVGGSGSFSYTDNKSAAYTNYKSNQLSISPNVGYFFIDKLAFGTKISILTSKANFPSTPTYQNYLAKSSSYGFGPFGRYYLLNTESQYNILIEGSYQYQIRNSKVSTTNSKQNANSYSFSAGPVIYFNSSVGIEFTIGFSSEKFAGFSRRNNSISANLGFQIHLEKDK